MQDNAMMDAIENAAIRDIARDVSDSIEQDNLPRLRELIEEDRERLKWTWLIGSWLHEAAYLNRAAMAEYLLNQGVPIDYDPGRNRGTALNTAATNHATETVRLLLKRGAKMDTSRPVTNPLFGAALKGSTEIVQLLLDHGIDATVRYTGERMKNMSVVEFADRQGQHAVRDQVRAFLARKGEGPKTDGAQA